MDEDEPAACDRSVVEPEKALHDKAVVVRVGDEFQQKFQHKPMCCLGGVKSFQAWANRFQTEHMAACAWVVRS